MSAIDTAAKKRAKKVRSTANALDVRALRLAAAAGLTGHPKTKHINAKVAPALFDAAARRVGSHSPAAVIEAALAALATQDDLGPWLASQWGSLADVDPQVLSDIEI